jgi:hypothetical protein
VPKNDWPVEVDEGDTSRRTRQPAFKEAEHDERLRLGQHRPAADLAHRVITGSSHRRTREGSQHSSRPESHLEHSFSVFSPSGAMTSAVRRAYPTSAIDRVADARYAARRARFDAAQITPAAWLPVEAMASP